MLYSIQQVTKPDPLDFVSVDDLALHLGLNTHDDDDLLSIYIKTAYNLWEQQTDGCIILPTTFKQWLPCWQDCIRLERGNVQSIDEFAYYTTDDTLTDVEDYTADLTGCPSWLFTSATPTSLSTVRRRPVVVTYTCGFSPISDEDPQEIPDAVRLYVLLMAAHFYQNREAFTDTNLNEVPSGCARISDMFKTPLGGTW